MLRIDANVALPATRQIKLGLNKSMFVELPREVRDVMVSNPKKLEAVMQTSTRAYLIGSEPGEASIFFTDKDGHRILTLEVSIERDLSALTDLLTRLIPGSKIRIDAIGERAVLTGTVRKPIDASRACEIVTSYLGPLDQQNTSSSATGGSATTINTAGNSSNGGSGLDNACKTTNVINMITVEGDEQVLLKVSVVEMERNIIKQFGIDLGTLINSGNFAFAALSNLPFPINSQGKGLISPFLSNATTAAGDVVQGTPSFVSQGVAGGGVQWLQGN
ncbi:MAG: pilus assembly protein N-terminal domain-containing protein, partial [Methyloceanibacter sp.]